MVSISESNRQGFQVEFADKRCTILPMSSLERIDLRFSRGKNSHE
jgi:hypothetical protein